MPRLTAYLQCSRISTSGRQSDSCYRPGTTDGQVDSNLGGAKEVTKDGKKVWAIEGHCMVIRCSLGQSVIEMH